MRSLNSPLAKVLYVAGVTTFCTFLGCWAVLAHQETSQGAQKPAISDEEFAKKASQGGLAEVKLGQLAEQNGTNSAVKQFGQRMVQDHMKANDQLKRAAARENISLPGDLDPKDQAVYDALAKLSGAAFDQAYARDMIRDHQQDIADFNSEANRGRKSAIKDFAEQTLPTLQDHLKQAREMRQTVLASGVEKTRAIPSGQSGRGRR
jgi:putative membrane protein